jgi:polysaccharide export outer membrane protein
MIRPVSDLSVTRPPSSTRLRPAAAAALLASAVLQGCADLPRSGPTGYDIVHQQRDNARTHQGLDFDIVEIRPGITGQVAPPTLAYPGLAGLTAEGEVDTVGPGDVLQITVFEVGAALFSPGGAGLASLGVAAAPTAAGENFPPVIVGRDGAVALPYVGRLNVSGRTVEQVQAMIAEALKGKSQAPQVIVSIRENVANTVFVIGDVKRPGRVGLSLARERLLDAIAEAGGGAYPNQDLTVRVSRGGREAEARLDRIAPGSADDLLLLPRDRIAVFYHPRSFTVFGATGHVAETPFQSPRVSLAEALARAGGPSEQTADPRSIYVFRYEPAMVDGAPAAGARPVAYHLDMMKPDSFFLAQTFDIQPRDVVYIANARANAPIKLVNVLNLFFQPAYTVKVLAQ